ncbi:4764_t:CDS:2, partial [Gigaspora rosea]
MDQSNISRKGYRALTTTSQDLPKEWLVSKEKNNVNETMQNHIPLLVFDMNAQTNNSGSNLDSEVTAAILETGTYRNISAILQFIIPKLVTNKVLSYENPIIYLRISGDRRNALGTENYTSLKTALEPICRELQELHKNG